MRLYKKEIGHVWEQLPKYLGLQCPILVGLVRVELEVKQTPCKVLKYYYYGNT